MPNSAVRQRPSPLGIRRLAWVVIVALLGVVAACGGTAVTPAGVPRPNPFFPEPTLAPTPTPSPTPSPSPSPSPTPMSTVDSFKAAVSRSDFQAQGSVVGSIKVSLIVGSSTGSVTGTFAVNGRDSADSITSSVLGVTTTTDNV